MRKCIPRADYPSKLIAWYSTASEIEVKLLDIIEVFNKNEHFTKRKHEVTDTVLPSEGETKKKGRKDLTLREFLNISGDTGR